MRGNPRAPTACGRSSWRGSRKVRAKMGASVGLAMTDQVVNEKPTAGGNPALEGALVIDVAVTYVDREAIAQSFL